MITLAVLFVFACVALPILAWAIELFIRLFAWTVRTAVVVLLAPLWGVVALVGGLAVAIRMTVPLVLLLAIASVLIPER